MTFVFYDRFIELCNKKGVKPSRVAIEKSFNKGSISSWKKNAELGKDVKPTTEILEKLADYFDVTVDYILGKTDERKPINHDVTDDDIKFALFGGDGEITDEMYNDVKNFAQFIKEKYKDKKE